MAKEKVIMTPKRAQEMQDEIFYNMSSEKKIKLTSQISVLVKKLKESKNVLNDTRRIIRKNS